MKISFRTPALALGAGLAITAATAAIILWLTNDMRLYLALGGSGLFFAALWLGRSRKGGLISFALLCLPLTAFYAKLVLPQLPGLWLHLAIWLSLAGLGWWGFGSRRLPMAATVTAMIAVSSLGSWYALYHIPGVISEDLTQLLDDPAPEFALQDLDGQAFPQESLENRVVVLDFFATWCGPCIAELPELAAIHSRYADEAGVEVLVVANDSGGDTPEAIRTFAQERDLDLQFLYDPDGKAHRSFGFAGLPGLAVIDCNNRIRLSREGYNSAERDFEENLVATIESLRCPGDTLG